MFKTRLLDDWLIARVSSRVFLRGNARFWRPRSHHTAREEGTYDSTQYLNRRCLQTCASGALHDCLPKAMPKKFKSSNDAHNKYQPLFISNPFVSRHHILASPSPPARGPLNLLHLRRVDGGALARRDAERLVPLATLLVTTDLSRHILSSPRVSFLPQPL